MTITDKPNTTGGQGGSSSQEHGAGVGIMAEQMMQETAGKVIPAGYKQTEVGVIPEDWSVETLSQVAQITRGKFSARPRNDPKFFGGNIPFIQTGDITRSNGYDVKFSQTINELGLSVSRLFPAGSLFFTIAANIGDVAIVKYPAACPDSLVVIKENEHINKRWLYHILLSKKESFESIATSNAQLNINLEKLNPYVLGVPALEEQTAIANVLSDSDALIDALEQLIAKKQAIKSATMQQLLTGRTRLPAFALHPDGTPKGYKPSELGDIPEDWDVKETSSFSAFITKGSTPTTYGFDWEKEGVLFLRSECVSETGLDLSESMYISEKANKVLSRSEVKTNDILITITGNVGRVIYLSEHFGKANINQHIARIRVIDITISPKYVYHYMSQIEVRRELNKITTGQAYPQLSLEQVRSIKIALPTIAEQTAIATILSDMDNELQALTQKLEKARALKQGMMQQLLTGKFRLPLEVQA